MTGKASERLRSVTADLHVHTCLSPCATLDMTPRKIVQEACKKGLAVIAVTDHNSAENAGAVMAAARDSGIYIIPGMEVTTSEEVHIVGLFPETESALSMQELVYERLQPGQNDEDIFGIQVVANDLDEVEAINKRMLIGATDLSVEQVIEAIHDRGGLAVAAHIERESFSIIGQLGFIPVDLHLDAIEVSKAMTLKKARSQFKGYDCVPLTTASDAHSIEEIGVSPLQLQVTPPLDIDELRLALEGRWGRKIVEDQTDLP